MSADTTPDTKPAEKPLITLLTAPPVDTDDEGRAGSQCCGGGSCGL